MDDRVVLNDSFVKSPGGIYLDFLNLVTSNFPDDSHTKCTFRLYETVHGCIVHIERKQPGVGLLPVRFELPFLRLMDSTGLLRWIDGNSVGFKSFGEPDLLESGE